MLEAAKDESEAPALSAGRAALFTSILLLVSILAALALGEIAVRVLAPQQLILYRPDIWMSADSVGWTNRPDVLTTVNTGERPVTFRTDHEGFRVGAKPAGPARKQVYVIGDSFAEALQVEYEQSFSSLLEQRLSQLEGEPVAVHDGGVDGWDPPQYLIRARQILTSSSPNLLVVALYLGNDVIMPRALVIPPRSPHSHSLRLPHALRWKEFVDAFLYPANDFLRTHSQLFVFFKNRLQTLRQQAGLSSDYFPPELRRSVASSPRWAWTADLCKQIDAAGASHGVPVLFVMIPSPVEVDDSLLHHYERGFHIGPDSIDATQPSRLMEEALRARGVHFVDATPAIRAAQSRGGDLYGHVDRHLSPAGHRLLTDLLAPVADSLLRGVKFRVSP